MDLTVITYENSQFKKICNLTDKMEDFFGHDKQLVESLQALMSFIELEDNIFNFKKPLYQGYNFEKCKGFDNLYSLRIIPKKRKSSYRMYLAPKNGGVEIKIIKIDNHTYKID